MNNSRNLYIALFTTVISFTTLYIPQPMLPMLAEEFNISASRAGLLITVTFLPLGLAPVVYGYFLQAIPARAMLSVALALLMVDQLAFYLVSEYWQLLALRSIQGLLLPAIFTALMTYCSTIVSNNNIRRTMGFYIGATVFGGFLGRAIGGYFVSGYPWYTPYVVMGFLLMLPLFALRYASADAEISFSRLDIGSISRVMKIRYNRYLYSVLGMVFFVYASILNLIPFRMIEIDPAVSPAVISIIYVGYLVGIPIALYSEKLTKLLGSDRRGLLAGLGLIGFAILCYLLKEFSVLLVMMFFFAGGFFFIHATLSGLVNHHSTEHKGVVNGLYVSIYYLSGALASWMPGIVYEIHGWRLVIIILMVFVMLSAWFVVRLTEDNGLCHE